MSPAPGRRAAAARGASGIAVAMAGMNIGTYGYTIVSARLLGPERYGAFAAVMGLLLVLAVVQLGLQATGARRIATAPDQVNEVTSTILPVTYRAATVLAVGSALLSPLVNRGLHLENLGAAALVGVIIWPITVMGGQAGVLQGERRWTPLALIYLSAGLPRLIIGSALIWSRPTETVALVGVAAGAFVPVLIGWWVLRETPHRRAVRILPGRSARQRVVLAETLHNSHALLAFFALANIDVILARSVLGSHPAGLYAGGIILTKAVLFLPQFIVVVAFPALSDNGNRRRVLLRGLSVIAAVGAGGVTATALLNGLALTFIGGSQYAPIRTELWLFAALGVVLSAVQFLVYAAVATRLRRSVYLTWAALAAVLLGSIGVNSVTGLILLMMMIDTALLGVLLGLILFGPGDPSGSRVSGTESVGGGAPVGAEADRDVERDGEVGGAGHLLADQ